MNNLQSYIMQTLSSKNSFAFLFFLFLSTIGWSQPGANDPTFNTLDSGNGTGDGSVGLISVSVFRPNGKCVVGGEFQYLNGNGNYVLAQLLENGEIDTTFNPPSVNGNIYSFSLYDDGRLLAGGDFMSIDTFDYLNLARFYEDGSLDTTFNIGTGFNNWVNAIDIQDDGKILVGGEFTSFNGSPCARIIRLNSDGSLDPSFNSGSGPNLSVEAIAVRDDGTIMIGGSFQTVNGVNYQKIARLNSNGTLDLSFDPPLGAFGGTCNTINLLPNGQCFASGAFDPYNGVSCTRILKFNTDGSIDPTYNVGYGSEFAIRSTQLQTDGKLIVAGEFSTWDSVPCNAIVRLNLDGSRDLSFTSLDSSVWGISLWTTSIQLDGKILVAGDFNDINGKPRRNIARLNSDGTLDSLYFKVNGANLAIFTSVMQADGKIIIAGSFTGLNDEIRNGIARINQDGTLDLTFDAGLGFSTPVKDLAIAPDGKILCGGLFLGMNGSPMYKVVRINTDGSQDMSFNPGTTVNNDVYTVAVQSDGKVLIGGTFTNIGGISRNRIARLNMDGTLDATFTVGTGASNNVNDIFIQPDGKILIAGNFTTYAGVARSRIARLNSNGTLDATFIPAALNSYAHDVEMQPDGKIVVVGGFTTIGGVTSGHIARYEANGAHDATFDPGFGTNWDITHVNILSTGKLLIGGPFVAFNGDSTTAGLLRLFSNGSIDTTFFPGEGTESNVYSTLVLDNGNYFISGSFRTYRGVGRNRMASVFSECNSPNAVLNITAYDSLVLNGSTYLTDGSYIQNLTTAFGCDSTLTINVTFLPNVPLSVQTFMTPTSANVCLGVLQVELLGDSDFQLSVDGATPFINSTGFQGIGNQCDGIHSLSILDASGDTLSLTYVIAVDSNYIYNNVYIDSIAVDSLGFNTANCLVDYTTIDTAYISQAFATGNTVTVVWEIISSTGISNDTVDYTLNQGNGVYTLQLSIYCLNKSLGDYFGVAEDIYFENGNISLAGIHNLELDDQITILPNPADDHITVVSTAPFEKIELYNLNGKQISEYNVSGKQLKIDLRDFEPSVYILRIVKGNSMVTRRIVVL